MKPYHVIYDTRATVKVAGFPTTELVCRWIWDPKDPAAVKLRIFEEDGALNDWIFSRNLLIDALRHARNEGEGDVKLKFYRELRKVMVTVSNLGQSAQLEFNAEEIVNFTNSTIIQLDPETEKYDMDATIERLLKDD